MKFSIDFKAEIVYCHLILSESLCSELGDVVFMHQKTFSEGLVIMNHYQLGWDSLSVGMGLSCILWDLIRHNSETSNCDV